MEQLLAKGNTVYATVRDEGNMEMQRLEDKNKALNIGILDVADPESINVGPLLLYIMRTILSVSSSLLDIANSGWGGESAQL